MRRAAPLHAHLHHALIFAGRGMHRLGLDHVHANRLLHVNVGARFHGGDHRQGVPVVGRADQYDVQVLLLEHLAVVAVGARCFVRCLPAGHDLRRLAEHPLVHVAQRNHLDRLDLNQPQEIDLAVPTRADQAHAPRLLACKSHRIIAHGRQRQRRCACADKLPATELTSIHGISPRQRKASTLSRCKRWHAHDAGASGEHVMPARRCRPAASAA